MAYRCGFCALLGRPMPIDPFIREKNSPGPTMFARIGVMRGVMTFSFRRH
jgi:hypothetical protein